MKCLPVLATCEELWLRYASWDLSTVYLADLENRRHSLPRLPGGQKQKRSGPAGAQSRRRSGPPPAPSGMAPLLQKIIQQYALTGLPPAYLPQPQKPQNPS